jgi:hypothetical protein
MPGRVQIPRHFNKDKLHVAAAPSGSRSLWRHCHRRMGAVQGLRRRALGKGTDTGFHLLGAEAAAYAVDDIDGVFRAGRGDR